MALLILEIDFMKYVLMDGGDYLQKERTNNYGKTKTTDKKDLR